MIFSQVFMLLALGLLVVAVWLYLIFARGQFWACVDTDDLRDPEPATWPDVVVVTPARDEAAVIGESLGGLLAQDYPGSFHVVLVDDQSDDGTAEIAQELIAQGWAEAGRLTVVSGAPPPPGWTGKPWAMAQGLKHARENFAPKYVLLTDADILHTPDHLRALVARAEHGGFGLVSRMALLRCESFAEKLLIPAFVYFFQMLYPFRFVRDPGRPDAAAAGGCMLARVDLLDRAGGLNRIKSALIDDCALGAAMKQFGLVDLRLTRRATSLRPYPAIPDIGQMISRSAYAQLRNSPVLLLGVMAAMVVTFFAPLWLAAWTPQEAGLWGDFFCGPGGALAFGLMTISFMPINRFYGLSRARALLLPLIAAIYMVYTLKSALDFTRGRGALWKGRAQAHGASAQGFSAQGFSAQGFSAQGVSEAEEGQMSETVTAESLRSGKTGEDENFPVASLLIAAPLRPVILAFYDFVRSGDDVADNPDLAPERKRALLDQLEASLTGKSTAEPLGVKLRAQLAARGLTDQHARDLLDAFRRDVDKTRYADWDELIDYCRLSAMPVGRFMLDVHGESRTLWPASDAICAALQINNHLQDCVKDFKALDRVYVPQDALARAGAATEQLGDAESTPALLACLQGLARKNRALLEQGAGLSGAIKDFRMGLEVAVIVGHARKIADLLVARDPLCENVKLSKAEMILGTLAAAGVETLARVSGRRG